MMKKRIIAFFVIIIMLLIPVSVFADTNIPDPPSEAWEYWVVVKNSQGYIYFVASHSPITVDTSGFKLNLGSQQLYSLLGDGTWNKTYEIEAAGVYYFSSMHKSNHDIAYDDGSGFFFLRPKVLRLIQAAKTADFGTILRTFLAGLIPLLGLLILGISLRKAFQFLRNQLMH